MKRIQYAIYQSALFDRWFTDQTTLDASYPEWIEQTFNCKVHVPLYGREWFMDFKNERDAINFILKHT